MTRAWVDDMKKKPVDKRWVMRCDVISPSGRRCKTTSEPELSQADLPLDRFQDEGWFVARNFGDLCPSCLAAGYLPWAVERSRALPLVPSTQPEVENA